MVGIGELTPEELAQLQAKEQAEKKAFIELLKSKGYKCDGSIEDYAKLFSNSQWFGDMIESNELMEFHFEKANGDANYFINFVKQNNYV